MTSSMSKMQQIIIKKINQKNNKGNIIEIRKIGKRILDKNMFYITRYL